jgi:hypothetical protein|tara:strand:- start:796 stop:999 length:204 start_codon:yes stop_codon:yes gene_type:complete
MSYIIVQHKDGGTEERSLVSFNMLDALIDETGTNIKKFKSEREAEDFLSECGVENWSEYYIEITRMH